MRKTFLCCSSALTLLALTVGVQAAPGGDRASAAANSSEGIVLAQAPAGAPAAAGAGAAGAPAAGGAGGQAGMPSGDDVKKMRKRAASKKRPSKAEMDMIKQRVPAEYHQYLNFR